MSKTQTSLLLDTDVFLELKRTKNHELEKTLKKRKVLNSGCCIRILETKNMEIKSVVVVITLIVMLFTMSTVNAGDYEIGYENGFWEGMEQGFDTGFNEGLEKGTKQGFENSGASMMVGIMLSLSFLVSVIVHYLVEVKKRGIHNE